MRARLCDDDGMVSHEPVDPPNGFDAELTYIKQLNNLRLRSPHPDARRPYRGEPFACTGHVHLAGEHIECTSPAHSSERQRASVGLDVGSGQGVTVGGPPFGRAFGIVAERWLADLRTVV